MRIPTAISTAPITLIRSMNQDYSPGPPCGICSIGRSLAASLPCSGYRAVGSLGAGRRARRAINRGYRVGYRLAARRPEIDLIRSTTHWGGGDETSPASRTRCSPRFSRSSSVCPHPSMSGWRALSSRSRRLWSAFMAFLPSSVFSRETARNQRQMAHVLAFSLDDAALTERCCVTCKQ